MPKRSIHCTASSSENLHVSPFPCERILHCVSFPQPHFILATLELEHKTKCSLSGSLPAPFLYCIYP